MYFESKGQRDVHEEFHYDFLAEEPACGSHIEELQSMHMDVSTEHIAVWKSDMTGWRIRTCSAFRIIWEQLTDERVSSPSGTRKVMLVITRLSDLLRQFEKEAIYRYLCQHVDSLCEPGRSAALRLMEEVRGQPDPTEDLLHADENPASNSQWETA